MIQTLTTPKRLPNQNQQNIGVVHALPEITTRSLENLLYKLGTRAKLTPYEIGLLAGIPALRG